MAWPLGQCVMSHLKSQSENRVYNNIWDGCRLHSMIWGNMSFKNCNNSKNIMVKQFLEVAERQVAFGMPGRGIFLYQFGNDSSD